VFDAFVTVGLDAGHHATHFRARLVAVKTLAWLARALRGFGLDRHSGELRTALTRWPAESDGRRRGSFAAIRSSSLDTYVAHAASELEEIPHVPRRERNDR
jgi:hypothetical protein